MKYLGSMGISENCQSGADREQCHKPQFHNGTDSDTATTPTPICKRGCGDDDPQKATASDVDTATTPTRIFKRVQPVRWKHDTEARYGMIIASPIPHQACQRPSLLAKRHATKGLAKERTRRRESDSTGSRGLARGASRTVLVTWLYA